MRDEPSFPRGGGSGTRSRRPLGKWLLAHRLTRAASDAAPLDAEATLQRVADWLDDAEPGTQEQFRCYVAHSGLQIEKVGGQSATKSAPNPDGGGERTIASMTADAHRAALLLEEVDTGDIGGRSEDQNRGSAQRKLLAAQLHLPIGVPERVRDASSVRGLPGLILQRKVDARLMQAADLMVHTLDLTNKKESTLKAYWGNTRVLREYFLSRGWDPNRWSYDHVASFCCLYVCYGNKASNLESIRCAWTFCAKADDYSFTHADQARVRNLIKGLIKITDQGHRNFAWPWLYEFTFKAASRWGRSANLNNIRFLAGCALRGGTGARGSTSFTSPAAAKKGDFNITKSHVAFTDDATGRLVTVHLPPGKGPAREVTFADIEENPFCTYALLRRWYEASNMTAQPATAPFFPKLKRSGDIDWKHEQSSQAFVTEAKKVAKFIGLPDHWIRRITGHSWRAGCATDLLSRDIAMWKVQLIGGWRSEAVLLYARITPATMAAWTGSGQTNAARPLLPAQFARLARLNTPRVDATLEPVTTASMSDFMEVARGYMRPLTGAITNRDQMSAAPFISLFN